MPLKAKEDDMDEAKEKQKHKANNLFVDNEEMKEPVSADLDQFSTFCKLPAPAFIPLGKITSN